jgi:hypothetical protein
VNRASAEAMLAALPKASETIIAFAKPLTALLDNPPSASQLQNAMHIAATAWNLPLYEHHRHPNGPGFRAIWDSLLAQVPVEFRSILCGLVAARAATIESDPRMIVVQVDAGPTGDARIVATAALLGS